MPELEDLEKRKKELELRRDIARLERNERIAHKAADIAADASNLAAGISATVQAKKASAPTWSWLWVGPLMLLGLYLIAGGLVDGPIALSLVGVVLVVPALGKLFGRP